MIDQQLWQQGLEKLDERRQGGCARGLPRGSTATALREGAPGSSPSTPGGQATVEKGIQGGQSI